MKRFKDTAVLKIILEIHTYRKPYILYFLCPLDAFEIIEMYFLKTSGALKFSKFLLCKEQVYFSHITIYKLKSITYRGPCNNMETCTCFEISQKLVIME